MVFNYITAILHIMPGCVQDYGIVARLFRRGGLYALP